MQVPTSLPPDLKPLHSFQVIIMELQISYPVLFTFLCFFLLLWSTCNSKKSTKNLPPGPSKLPLIGNIHQFIGKHPHHILRDLAKKYGPIMHLQLGQISNVVVSSPEIVKEIFKTHDAVISNRSPQLATDVLFYDRSDLIFSPYGSQWRQLRRICTLELLTTKRVQSFRLIREEKVSALIKKVTESEGSVINLSREIYALTNDITARAAFGKKSRDQEKFLNCLEEMARLTEGFSIADLYPSIKVLQKIGRFGSRVQKTHREVDKILEKIVRDHKERNGVKRNKEEQDMVDALLKIQQRDDLEIPLTHDNVKGVILDIFAAGTETSSTSVDWAMSELMKNPEIMQEAQREVRKVYGDKGFVDESELHKLQYLKSVIRETWRLHPPAPLLVPRENSEKCVINGYEIPAKSRIIVNFWSIARDPMYWIEPEKFKPERFLDNPIDHKGTNYEYIPFGAGRRICPGITFATPNVELPLASLLYHFNWKLPERMKLEEFDMSETFGVTVRRKVHLNLIPICYRP